jgi:hypothetical protein
MRRNDSVQCYCSHAWAGFPYARMSHEILCSSLLYPFSLGVTRRPYTAQCENMCSASTSLGRRVDCGFKHKALAGSCTMRHCGPKHYDRCCSWGSHGRNMLCGPKYYKCCSWGTHGSKLLCGPEYYKCCSWGSHGSDWLICAVTRTVFGPVARCSSSTPSELHCITTKGVKC